MLEAVCGICKEKSTDFITLCDKPFHETCLDQVLVKASACPSCKTATTYNPKLEKFLADFTGTEEQVGKLDRDFILKLFESKYSGYPVESVFRRFLELGGNINTKNSTNASLLHIAVENSNEGLVKALLSNEANVNILDSEGRNPLHIACKNLNLPIIKLLIEAGADNKAQDHEGCPPYFYALDSRDKDSEVLKYLLETGTCDLSVEDRIERNCLNYAVKNGTIETLVLLIKKGAKIIIQRRRFGTVHQAVASNKLDILHLLVETIKVPCDMTDGSGTTPLILAAKNGKVEMVKLLLEHGAKPFKKDCDEASALFHAVARNHYEVVELLLKISSRTINDAPFLSNPPIFRALEGKNIKMAELLLTHRASFDIKSREGWNIVEFLCAKNAFKEGIEFLLAKTRLPFQNFMAKYAPNSKALILLACSHGATDSVKKLMELGFDLKEKDGNLNTALHLACKYDNYELLDDSATKATGNNELVDFLLNQGFNPLERNRNNETPLSIVINTPVLKRVLQSCPNPVEVERQGDAVFPVGYVAIAAVHRSKESIKLLINHGADVNIPTPQGITAFHCACQYKDLEMIDILIKAGFEINKPFRSRPGIPLNIPIAFALTVSDENIVRKLLENGASIEKAKEWIANHFPTTSQ